jgi:hypothetical protein
LAEWWFQTDQSFFKKKQTKNHWHIDSWERMIHLALWPNILKLTQMYFLTLSCLLQNQ